MLEAGAGRAAGEHRGKGQASCCGERGGGGLGCTQGFGIPAPPAPTLLPPRPAQGVQACVSPSPTRLSHSHRDQHCDYFVRTFVQTSPPGQFHLGNIEGES